VGIPVTYTEYPLFIPAGGEALCGVLAWPMRDTADVGVVFISGHQTRAHRNRMFVRAARGLTARGIPSVRFDQRGSGDSTGDLHVDLRAPSGDDVARVVDVLVEATGVSRVVLLTTCVGGATGMDAAARHPALAAVVAFSMPILVPRKRDRRPLKKRFKRWLRPRLPLHLLLRIPGVHRLRRRKPPPAPKHFEVSPPFREALGGALRRGAVVRFVFGEHTGYLRGLRWCLQGVASILSPEERGRVRLDVVRGLELHRFMSLGEQDALVAEAIEAVQALVADGFRTSPSEEIEEGFRPTVLEAPMTRAPARL
jgi:pimeloyl-ACP methyl ester carboxylesterase